MPDRSESRCLCRVLTSSAEPRAVLGIACSRSLVHFSSLVEYLLQEEPLSALSCSVLLKIALSDQVPTPVYLQLPNTTSKFNVQADQGTDTL